MLLQSKAFDVNNNFVVSLDGPAASGKSTIARIIATKFALTYYQSGLIYRYLALICIKNNIKSTDIEAVIKSSQTTQYDQKEQSKEDLNDENLGIFASQIAVIPEVRDNLGRYLITLIEKTPRIIMEGRDIGTVIAAAADLKIFIKADINIRAERRYQELCNKGMLWTFTEVLSQLKIRDQRDTERLVAPLIPPKDAIEIDTSFLTPIAVVDKIVESIFLG